MKLYYAFAINILLAGFGLAQTFQVTVNGGFGSGSFQAGEVVHVFANQMQNTQIFDRWMGDVEFEHNNEWHGRFIMPAQDVTVAASYRSISAFSIDLEEINFQDEPKQVFYYFPEVVRGTIFLFHEFAGRAQDWLFRSEYNRFMVDAVADSFAVVFFSAHEMASKTGLEPEIQGGIEEFAWDIESLTLAENVDLQFLNTVIDTLKARGTLESSPKLYAVGMGAGGMFAQLAANVLNFRALTIYGTAGIQDFNDNPEIPTQWMLCENDESEITGAEGNQEAETAYQTYQSQEVCSRIYVHTPSPLYRERILMDPSFEPAQVNNIFQELINAEVLLNNRALVSGSRFLEIYNENPTEYLTINGLVDFQRMFLAEQIDVAYAAHQFYSDLNRQTLAFFKSFCGVDTVFQTVGMALNNQVFPDLIVYPNPTDYKINLRISKANVVIHQISILDLQGRTMKQENSPNSWSFDVSELKPGIYLVNLSTSHGMIVKRFFKN